ncbi:MAG: hypothetical protein IJQ67_02775 [Bacilli bacterium]|nr:hypothetical protein [Bacilli bacterium]
MKSRFFSPIILFLSTSLCGCSFSSLSPSQVDENFWNVNISQGGLFSSDNNFTLDRQVLINNQVTSTGVIKNENGKIHVEIKDTINDYYQLLDEGGYRHIYNSEDEGWVIEEYKTIDGFKADILDYTIIHTFEYQAFSYDSTKEAYIATNYDSDNYKDEKTQSTTRIQAEYVEFKFYNKKVTSFKAVINDTTYILEARDYDKTKVDIPDGKVMDNSNPYWYTKHKLSNVVVETSEYKEVIEDELKDAYLYVIGDKYTSTEVQLVTNLSRNIVIVYFGVSEDYKSATKSFNISFDKRMGYGKDYDPSSDENRLINIPGAVIKEHDMELQFALLKDEKKEEVVYVDVTATLTNKEDITDRYEYPHAEEQLKSYLNHKKIEISNVVFPNDNEKGIDIFTGGFLVIDIDNEKNVFYVEFVLNNQQILLGFALFNSYDDEAFRIDFECLYDVNKDEKIYLGHYSADIELINDTFNLRMIFNGVFTKMDLNITSISINPQYKYFIDDKYSVSKDAWNSYFSLTDIADKKINISYYKYRNEQIIDEYHVLYNDYKGNYRTYIDNTNEFVDNYFEIIDNGGYRYTCPEYEGWQKTFDSNIRTWLFNLSGLKPYNYDDATYETLDVGGCYYLNGKTIRITFIYDTLDQIEIKNDDGAIEYYSYQFIDIPEIEMPI